MSSELRMHDSPPLTSDSYSPLPHVYSLDGPLAPFGLPVWNPFFALRETEDSDRMRPVPVVFLRFAFSPQLSVHLISIRRYESRLSDHLKCR